MHNILKITHIKRCFLIAKNAEPIPPLGTILGNLGISTIKFCEEFNNFTKNLPSYFYLKVKIIIYENRTFSFNIEIPSTSYFLNLLKFEKIIKIKSLNKINLKSVFCIKLKDLIKLTLFKFPKLDLKYTIFMIIGCIKSLSIIIIY